MHLSKVCKIMIINFLIILPAFLIFKNSQIKEKPLIVVKKMGEETLFIPHEYLAFEYTSIGRETGLIQTYFPGNIPLPTTPEILHKNGQWHKAILVSFTLLNSYPKFSLENTLTGYIDLYDANFSLGHEYNLEHISQKEKNKRFKKDLWLEKRGNSINSIIACGEKYDEIVVPQCTLYFIDKTYEYSVDFDKTLLSDWKIIKYSVSKLIESFGTKEKSMLFYKENSQIVK